MSIINTSKTAFFSRVCALVFAFALPITATYAAGQCCRGHEGVTGCDVSGYKICGDKSLSPSCKCKYKAPKAVKKVKEMKPKAAKTTTEMTPKATAPKAKSSGNPFSNLFKSKSTKATTTSTTSNKGCCSKHGGVDSCVKGVTMCKDKTQSPTCTCQ